MKKIKNQVRQGDILINPVASVPEQLTPVVRENGKVILAHGEVTGHHHALMEPGVELLKGESEAERFLSAPDGASLRHQEHATIPITKTASPRHVIRQREYSDELSRQVSD